MGPDRGSAPADGGPNGDPESVKKAGGPDWGSTFCTDPKFLDTVNCPLPFSIFRTEK